ncbi:hypothetical protein HAX54_038242 [Datura stramonium]|uniref:Uncharacterized protein n=1 Tax=Datura stramonium TaxID=4076 RepID=A0ABS8SIT9_DATST|nr:hypothetical protein [Datura stramonium]
MSLHSTSSATKEVPENGQHVSLGSTSSETQVVPENGQHLSLGSTSSTTQALPKNRQQVTVDTTNHETNEKIIEQGPSIEKRGRTDTQSVHGRTERKLTMLNKYNQPIGPTVATVQEWSSFLSTLARNSTFCPLNVKDWMKVDIKNDMWKYIKAKMEKVQTQQSEDGTQSVDAYELVMGPKHPGRVILYGRGITKTVLKKKVGDPPSSTNELMQHKMEEIE